MENREQALVGGIILLLLAGGAYLLYINGFFAPPIPTPAELEAEMVLDNLNPGTYVASPFTFSGRATKEWFDENGTFLVEIRDGANSLIGQGEAQAEGVVDESGTVRFSAAITFSEPAGEEGVITLNKANPKNLPGHDFGYGVVVSFVEQAQEQ